MICVKTLPEMKAISRDLAADSAVQSVAVIHFRESRILDGTFHEGHEQFVQMVRGQFDKVIIVAVPILIFSADDTTHRIIDNGMSGDVILTPASIQDMESRFPFVDYMYLPKGTRALGRSIIGLINTPEYHATMAHISDHTTSHAAWLRLLTYAEIMKSPFMPELLDKAEMITSRKETEDRITLWYGHIQTNGDVRRLRLNNNPVFLDPDINTTLQNRVAPIHRDAQGLIPELDEPDGVREVRLALHDAFHSCSFESRKELVWQLGKVPLPTGYRIYLDALDYTTIDLTYHEDPNAQYWLTPEDTLPALGQVRLGFSDGIHDFDDYRFLGTDETKWFDIKTLTDL